MVWDQITTIKTYRNQSFITLIQKKPPSTTSRREMVWKSACREIEAAARVDPVLDFLWRELKGVPAPDGDEGLKERARKILANSFGSSFRQPRLRHSIVAFLLCVSPVANVLSFESSDDPYLV